MKYLSLNNDEFKELLSLRKSNLLGYLITLLIVILVSYTLLKRVIPGNMDVSAMSLTLLIALSYFIIFVYSNKSYFKDLIKGKKKVYKGVLSGKTFKATSGKYQFNVDGNIFVVDKETFETYEEGDIMEFHTSPLTKYLFKVEKVGKAW